MNSTDEQHNYHFSLNKLNIAFAGTNLKTYTGCYTMLVDSKFSNGTVVVVVVLLNAINGLRPTMLYTISQNINLYDTMDLF